jgi:hypothetical protein
MVADSEGSCMRCPDARCRTKNPRHATHCLECGEELPTVSSRWSRFFTGGFAVFFVVAFLYLDFGGIYFAFARHGTHHGIIAIFVPPYAWYRAISPLWDTPKWQQEALDSIESVAYVVLNAQSADPAMRADMAERIPKLRRLYQRQTPEFRASLDQSLAALVELMDAIGRDILDEILRRGTLTIDKAAIIQRHQILYDCATRYEGLRAALEATMLDAEYVQSMFSLTDTTHISLEDRARIRDAADSTFKRWKDGALQTKDRILR